MNQLNKLWKGKKLRAVYDRDRKIWLVSAIDVIAAINSSSYDNARNYWKQLKLRLKTRNHSLVRKTSQIKLPAKDGLYRYTDVIDYREIVKLIQAMPYKTAKKVRDWLGEVICSNKKVSKSIEGCIKEVPVPKKYHFVKHVYVKAYLI